MYLLPCLARSLPQFIYWTPYCSENGFDPLFAPFFVRCQSDIPLFNERIVVIYVMVAWRGIRLHGNRSEVCELYGGYFRLFRNNSSIIILKGPNNWNEAQFKSGFGWKLTLKQLFNFLAFTRNILRSNPWQQASIRAFSEIFIQLIIKKSKRRESVL